ncbi:ATP-binding protein [Desulfopila sp. IMCC35008]|uniref:ATP-binding protein n=1 Tax=Desulfopila sp. IMCC35008 TaxID=2653858 RepID=UPI0013D3F2A4|nr:ATP-binding protein [Desulfopila sp. IMCC35008]
MTYFKGTIVFVLILAISFLHMQTVQSEYGLHILHRELFFIPIILASFWFGLRPGLVVAFVVCIIYAPLVLNHEGQHTPSMTPIIMAQLAMYLLVSFLIGWLRDRQQGQHEKLVAGERVTALARAAATLSFEIKDVVNSLDTIHVRASGLKDASEEGNFKQEIKRLHHLVEILSRYIPEEEQQALSTDLNTLLEASYNHYKQKARKEGIELVLQMDPVGCPTMIVSDSLERTIHSLVDNALEVSERGKKVFLRSRRGGDTCQLEVADEGKGVSEKDLDKLFTPFFTTKKHGSGLALAAGRKVLRDHGGDLVYASGSPSGAIFKIIVPRESEQNNIDEFARMKQLGST